MKNYCYRSAISLSGLMAGLIVSVAFGQTSYTVTDLGTLGTGFYSSARGINNSGTVVGTSYTTSLGSIRGFRYHASDLMRDLGALPSGFPSGILSEGLEVNNLGYIVGRVEISPSVDRAFISDGLQMIDIGTLGGSSARGYAINDSGQIVGYATTAPPSQIRAFLYSGGAMQDLGTLGGPSTNSIAYAINSYGQVVGSAQINFFQWHAFLHSDGMMVDLGTLGTNSEARDINDAGQIVGFSTIASGASHAFLYSAGVMQDLGTLPGGANSFAYAINNQGQVVGSSDSFGGARRAVLYSGRQIYDLNNFIAADSRWVLNEARGINDRGQIVGTGINPSGLQRAFLLTPNPNPRPTKSDFNGDARSDILWQRVDGLVRVWLMNGASRENEIDLVSPSAQWNVAGIGDYDGDGNDDILWLHSSGLIQIWFLVEGRIDRGQNINRSTLGWQVACSNDFNGDGMADIFLRHDDTGATHVLLMSGAEIAAEGTLLPQSSDWQTAGCEDFNGDGKSDVLWRNTQGDNQIWLLNGHSIINRLDAPSVTPDWNIAGVGDFNGDGLADIFWLRPGSPRHDTHLWLMRAIGPRVEIIGEQPLLRPLNAWQVAQILDLDGDGTSDIVWRQPSTGANGVWFMRGLVDPLPANLLSLGVEWSSRSGR